MGWKDEVEQEKEGKSKWKRQLHLERIGKQSEEKQSEEKVRWQLSKVGKCRRAETLGQRALTERLGAFVEIIIILILNVTHQFFFLFK